MKNIRVWFKLKNRDNFTLSPWDIACDEDVYVKLNIPDTITYKVVTEKSSNTDNNDLVVKDGEITFYCDKYHLPIKVTNKEVFDLIHEEYIGDNVMISFDCYKKNEEDENREMSKMLEE